MMADVSAPLGEPSTVGDLVVQEHQQQQYVLHDWNIVPAKPVRAPFHAPQAARLARRPVYRGPGPVTWTISDIANAARLLHTPEPLPVDFGDEHEMRRVYTLIYDVFRYKNIMSQSLNDVLFFVEHPNMSPLASRVWLILFDMYHRSFRKRTPANAAQVAELFPSADLMLVEETLWQNRVKLAAAIARIRIKNKALRLSQLLPHHLRDGKTGKNGVRAADAPVTCWVNTKKIRSPEDLVNNIAKHLQLELIDETTTLTDDTFKWDTHCPHFVVFHPGVRSALLQSVLVKKNKLIVQDKSFCLGPATFTKIISDLQLTGSVIQSHVNSPRTTAYLASILSQNDNIKKLLAFSAGTRKTEYENYFNDLGIKNIHIFAEKMIDLPPDSNSLEEVIAVFATPPNSYSAVADPIDLVCSRGGDLTMLEVLTETEDTAEGRRRVANILDEQKQTLKYAMSRPQIQFVLYETHSEIDAENTQMVQRTVREINRCAHIHHAVAQGKLKSSSVLYSQRNDLIDDGMEENISVPTQYLSAEEKRNRALKEVIVPESDLFDLSNIPDLCLSGDDCLNPMDKGCFLALVQRKRVTRMDNKYMIQMAETRGVFGADPGSPKKGGGKPSVRFSMKRSDENSQVFNSPARPKRRSREFEVERLQHPTKASMGHSKNTTPEVLVCARSMSATSTPTPPARRWWAETARHIANVRATVAKRSILSNKETSRGGGGGGGVDVGTSVDEVVARSRRNPHTIPVAPRLRLSRPPEGKLYGHQHHHEGNKVPIQVAVTMVTFPPPRAYY